MATVLHKNLSGSDLHEPKGAADANANETYVADGAGAGGFFALVPVGTVFDYCGSTEPVGFLFANGETIGNASSNATARANADTETLFTLLWNSSDNSELPILDSTGEPSTRGANAATDYAANKALPLPDYCGRVSVGRDNMGVASKNRLTGITGSVNADTIFATGGGESVTLLQANLPDVNFSHSLLGASHNHTFADSFTTSTDGSHTHVVGYSETGSQGSLGGGGTTTRQFSNSNSTIPASGSHNHSGSISGTTGNSGTLAITGTVSSGGEDTPFSKVQPTIVVSKIIFYGAF